MNFNSETCIQCKGRGYCGKPCPILKRFSEFQPKVKTSFSGSSPPEIFVGRYNYPNVNTGILAPAEYGQTEEYSMPELWHKKNFSINKILSLRAKLIYGKFKSNVKDTRKEKRILKTMQEISLADRKVDTEFILSKPVKKILNIEKSNPLITNSAQLKSARLQENPHVHKKVDYLTSDTNVKSSIAINELYNSKVNVSNIIKILSAGLLGKKTSRKLVPTRWAITATDDTLSKTLLEKIRYYPEISEILLFNSEYVGNHYEFLLLPEKFSFEVIEAYMKGSIWNLFSEKIALSQDYESFNGRKNYASNVTGAYYTARLALCEYFNNIKKQGACLVLREERPEYNAPLGVGILRECSRQAFTKKPEKFSTIQEALNKIKTRLKLGIEIFKDISWLLREYKKQKRLGEWF
ncbi:MAG: Nre family DNA repair protein [Nanoarchaeota archaeon]|nr:Nre family DNA repair protein [Nanoarchaeota archaeon]